MGSSLVLSGQCCAVTEKFAFTDLLHSFLCLADLNFFYGDNYFVLGSVNIWAGPAEKRKKIWNKKLLNPVGVTYIADHIPRTRKFIQSAESHQHRSQAEPGPHPHSRSVWQWLDRTVWRVLPKSEPWSVGSWFNRWQDEILAGMKPTAPTASPTQLH